MESEEWLEGRRSTGEGTEDKSIRRNSLTAKPTRCVGAPLRTFDVSLQSVVVAPSPLGDHHDPIRA